MMRKLLMAATAVLALTGAARSEEFKDYAKVGDWNIVSSDGHCAAAGNYQNGTSLIFGVEADGGTWLRVYNGAWKIPAGEYKVGGSIDKVPFDLTFRADETGARLTNSFRMDSDAYNLLTKGARLTLNIGSTTYQYLLRDTSAMIPRLLECIGQVAKASNPFHGRQAAPVSAPSNPFKRT